MKRLFIILALLCAPLMAQNWSAFLDPSRAIDWTTAGFAIPSYTVPCSTQPSLVAGGANAGANTTSVQASAASCDSTHNVINIPAGTWDLNLTTLGSQGLMVARGAGPNLTTIVFHSTGGCAGGIGNQGWCLKDPGAVFNGNAAVLPPSGTQQCLWTGTNGSAGVFTQGATAINLTSCGGTPPNGKIIVLDQANDPQIAVSSFTGTSGTLSFTNTGNNTLTSGQLISLYGFTSPNTALNNQTVTVSATGLTGTTFQAAVTGSGYASGAGSAYDTGGVYICQQNASINCNNNGTGNNNGRVIGGVSYSQQQVAKITSVSSLGGGAFDITISPGVYFTNVRPSQTPGAWWPGFVQLLGVESMQLAGSALSGGTVGMDTCYRCWVKNVVSTFAARNHVGIYLSLDDVVRDSYFYEAQTHGTSSYGVELSEASQVLIENNIFQKTVAPVIFGQGSGSVVGYNLAINDYFTGNGSTPPDVTNAANASHNSGNDMNLWEGNVIQALWSDGSWGSSAQNTYYRNFISGFQVLFPGGSAVCSPILCESVPIINRAFSRGFNVVGNVLGHPGVHVTYQIGATSATGGTAGVEDTAIYSLGFAGGGFGSGGNCSSTLCDPIAVSGLMRWGNYDAVNKVNRFNSAEAAPVAIPYLSANFTTLYFNGLAQTLPASLYLSSQPAFWTGGKAWPAIGPDIAAGNVSTCSGGSYDKASATLASQCAGGTLNSASSTATAWGSRVASIPAVDCYFSLGGQPDGNNGSALAFDANVCYLAASATASGQMGNGARISNGAVVK